MIKTFKNRNTLTLIMVFVVSVLVIITFTVALFYKTAQNNQLSTLSDIAKDEASMIKTLYELNYSDSEILKIIRISYRKHESIGNSGEIVIAKMDDDRVLFLLGLNKDGNLSVLPNSKSDNIATPTKKALSGKTGSCIGNDYSGDEVLAGFTYITELKWGIVAKIDREEFNAPYYSTLVYLISINLFILLIGTLISIRENKKLIGEKSDSETKFKNIFNGIADSAFFADKTGKIIEVNDTACEKLSYTREEILNLYITDIDSPEAATKALENLKIIEVRGDYTFVASHRDKYGNVLPVEVHAKLVKINDEKFYLGIARDIKEQQEMIKKMNDQKQRLFVTLQSIGDAVIATDINGRISLINPIAESLTGWNSNDAIGEKIETVFRIINQKTREKCVNPIDIVISKGIRVGLANNTALISRDGIEYIIANSGSPILDEDGRIIGAILVFRDVTAQHSMQEEINESDEKFRLFLEHSPVYVFFKDEQIKSLQLSKNFEQMLGRPIQDLLGKNMFDLFPSDLALKMIEDDKRIIRDGSILKVEEEFNGRYYTTIKFPVYRENKTPILAGFTIDNTDRILTEKKLIKSEEKFSKAFKLSPDSVNINRLSDGVYIDVNLGFTIITGFSPDEVIGKSSLSKELDIWVNHDDRAKLVNEIQNSGEIYNFEAEFRKKDGSFIIGSMSAKIIEIDGEQCLLNITKDITESKRAEKQLKEAKEELDNFFNLSVDLLCIADLNGYFRRVNIAWEVNFGYKIEELLAVKFTNFIHPDDQEKTQFAMEELKNNQPVLNFINRYRDSKGEYHWVEWQAKNVNNMVYAGARDITFRKIVEETLHESERRLFTLMSNLPGMAYRCKNNFNWTMEFVSEGCVALTGYSSNNFINDHDLSYMDIIMPEFRKYVWDVIQSAIDKHEQFELNYQIRTAFGEIKWVWERGSGVYSNEGVLQLIEGFIWDITQNKKYQDELIEKQMLLRKQNNELAYLNDELGKNYQIINHINDELKKAKEKAEESDKLKTAFLANMSHEIRTPMNAILGFSKLLNSVDINEEERKEFISLIHRRGHDLLNLINDILDVSKIEANQIDLHYSQMEVNETILEVLNTFENVERDILSDDVDLRFGKHLPEGCFILSDVQRLRQIFINLIGNAVKFTHSGYIQCGYEINEDDNILFYVEDTGIGISEENLNIIFDRFRQADENMIGRAFEGFGLGLTISRALITKFGGKIWAESKPDIGSTFYFTLPYIPVFNPQFEKIEDHKENYDWFDKNFLIVEDDFYNSKFLLKLISFTGAGIQLVEKGESAIQAVNQQKSIDVILLDIKLPDMSGLSVARKIREFNKSIPIIAQTAFATEEDRFKSLDAGCNDFISKPIDPDEFYRKIELIFKH